jgi:hypothetical protein
MSSYFALNPRRSKRCPKHPNPAKLSAANRGAIPKPELVLGFGKDVSHYLGPSQEVRCLLLRLLVLGPIQRSIHVGIVEEMILLIVLDFTHR